MDLRQDMLHEFREELSTTERLLERVPEDKLGPTASSQIDGIGPTRHPHRNASRRHGQD
jgi:hypothetical protein